MRIAVLGAVLLAFGASGAQAAQPGTLDRGFGSGGVVATGVPGGVPSVAGLEVLPGGRILLVGTVGDGRIVLLRYLSDGRRDRRFGTGGVVSLRFPGGVRLDEALLTDSGDLLLAGSLGTRYAGQDAAVLKLRRDGELDRSFGVGGIWRSDLGGESGETATALAPQSDGRLLVAVDIDQGQPPTGSWRDLAVTRLSSRGQVDPTFGQSGLLRIDGTWERPYTPAGLAWDAQGRILVAYNSGYTPKLAVSSGVFRFDADGRHDASYGGFSSGLLFSFGEPTTHDMAFDTRQDRVVLGGRTFDENDGRSYPFVGTTRPPLVPDPSNPPYYGDQHALRPAEGRRGGAARSVLLDSAGSILVGGFLFAGGDDFAHTDLFVARTTADITLDPGFGRGGLTVVRLRGRRASIGAMALQPDGKLLAAGPVAVEYPRKPSRSFHLIRLNGGYDRRAPRLSIRLRGQRCAGRLHVNASAADDSPLQQLSVHIGGRLLRARKQKRLTLVLPSARRRPGVHTLVVRAVDVAGNRAVRRRRFTCPSAEAGPPAPPSSPTRGA
jgi:uncharacterized delta-60 repeat protein